MGHAFAGMTGYAKVSGRENDGPGHVVCSWYAERSTGHDGGQTGGSDLTGTLRVRMLMVTREQRCER